MKKTVVLLVLVLGLGLVLAVPGPALAVHNGTCPEGRMELAALPESCPCCGHSPVAVIMYGLPRFNDALEQALASGRLELGGCVVTDDDPRWHCAACGRFFWPSAARPSVKHE